MAGKFCGTCGAPLAPGATVCANCGAPVMDEADNDRTMRADETLFVDGQNESQTFNSGGSYSSDEDFLETSYGDYSANDSYASGDYYSDGSGYASGNGYNPGYQQPYNPGYQQPYNPGNAPVNPPAGGGSGKKLPIFLIIGGAVLVLLIAVVVLQLTGVIKLGGNKDSTTANTEGRTVVAAVSEETAAAAMQMTLTGVVKVEEYNGNKIYYLEMDGQHTFTPTGDDATRLGSQLSTDKVQLIGDNAAAYVGHSVCAKGSQSFKTETAHKYDVILENVTFDDYGEVSTAANTTAATEPTVGSTAEAYNPPPPAGGGGNVGTGTSGAVISATMSASTYQPNNGARYYRPQEANDNNDQTCWMAYNASNHGAGVSITMSFSGTQRVSGIRFINGNNWITDADVFHLNGRVKGFTLSYDGGTITTRTASDEMGYQYVYFDTPVDASYITLSVNSTYWGTKYDTVVCLAELQALY